ncbi:MAG: DUF1648 domain-containing protein [Candidatus Pacearchaeota archaeon]|jgi:uncharacterized membrane protein
MKKTYLAAILIIVFSFLIGIYSYAHLPDKVASHWNSNGLVDGYMSKFWGIFLMPLISMALFLLFLFLPGLDPLKNNYKAFKNYYDSFILVMIVFLFYAYLLTILWNFGVKINMNLSLIPALGFLFFYIGMILNKLKRNWFIGIKTPWTVSSDKVWEKTHKLGSVLFKISGIITIIGVFFPSYIIWFTLLPVILSSVWLIIYSYLEYRKIKKKI